LSREVPHGYLELVCLAFGGKVGWEGPNSPISANDPTITHHIVDRPKLPSSYDSLPKSREFVQPQWILDCSNFMFLLPIAKYEAGKTLPPHLSPWVDNEEEGYQPAYAEEIERLRNGEVLVASEEVDDQEMEVESNEVEEKEGNTESDNSASEDEEEVEEDEEGAEKKKARAEKRQKREVSFFFFFRINFLYWWFVF
jgi:pescadillo protein